MQRFVGDSCTYVISRTIEKAHTVYDSMNIEYIFRILLLILLNLLPKQPTADMVRNNRCRIKDFLKKYFWIYVDAFLGKMEQKKNKQIPYRKNSMITKNNFIPHPMNAYILNLISSPEKVCTTSI